MGYLGAWATEYYAYVGRPAKMKSGLYDHMNSQQKTAIEGYMRTRSAQEFKKLSQKHERRLSVKAEKTAELVRLCNGLDDWEYDGCVDTGYLGAGHCSLGHQLRYAHYAKSVSTGMTLVFGSTCVSDFFDVSETVIRRMDKVRASISRELEIIPYMIDSDHVAEWKEKYKDFEEYTDKYGADVIKNICGEYATPMAWFFALDIPWTLFMLGVWDNAKKNKLREYEVAEARKEAAKVAANGDEDTKEKMEKILQYDYLHIVKLVTARAGEASKDEFAKLLDAASGICDAYQVFVGWYTAKKVANIIIDSMKRVLFASRRQVYGFMQKGFDRDKLWVSENQSQAQENQSKAKPKKTKTQERKVYQMPVLPMEGVRLATKGEVQRLSSKYLVASWYYPLGASVSHALGLMAWAFYGQQYMYDMGPLGGQIAELDKMNESLSALKVCDGWAKSGKMVESLNKLISLPDFEYLDRADDEDMTPEGFDPGYMVNWMYNSQEELHWAPKEIQEKISLALKLASENYHKPFGVDRLTPRQVLSLRSGFMVARKYLMPEENDDEEESYEQLGESWGKQVRNAEAGAGALPDDLDNVEKAQKVIENRDKIKLKQYDFHKKVCETVESKGFCSPKQAKYVEEVYEHLKSVVQAEEEGNPIRQGDLGKAKLKPSEPKKPHGTAVVDVDEDDGGWERSLLESEPAEWGYEEPEGETQVEPSGYTRPTGSRAGGLPSVAEMSQALGKGLFKSVSEPAG